MSNHGTRLLLQGREVGRATDVQLVDAQRRLQKCGDTKNACLIVSLEYMDLGYEPDWSVALAKLAYAIMHA